MPTQNKLPTDNQTTRQTGAELTVADYGPRAEPGDPNGAYTVGEWGEGAWVSQMCKQSLDSISHWQQLPTHASVFIIP